ncbi:MAG: arginine--tRNA ligase [Nanoarchaeota archaeon]|nr:arginine--tRNA ligase [Nanoarchaeota archaeon]
MKNIVVKLIVKETRFDVKEVENLIEIPPRDDMGDFAFPCFGLAKSLKKNPMAIAEDLVKKFRKELPKELSNVDFKGAYVNFFINKGILADGVLAKVKKKDFGENDLGEGKTRLVEYSQPNTHKAFHVGHIRGTSLGESLARIFRACGEKVTQMNYSGDTGMHIAKWIWCYKKYHSKEKLRDDESWIAGIYVDAVKRLGDDEKLQEEVNEINLRMEEGNDEEINDLWKKTRAMSIKSWDKIYEELGAHFDVSFFESEFEEKAKKEVLKMLEDGVAKKDDAVFMDLKDYSLGVWVLLRKDGTVLYSAKDIALALKKFKDFKSDNYLVTVGNEQKLHFEQLVKTLELMGLKKEAERYGFLPYGMVRFPEGKMSSRSGANVLYSDFSKEIVGVAKKGLKQRGYEGKDIDERALKIAIASMKYSMLKQDPKKTMIFDPKKDVSFEGDTGPYLLYSYARASSIIRKVKSKKAVKILDLKDSEIRLLKKIDGLGEVVEKAYENLAPNLIANYAFELSQMFNEFYHSCPVLGSDEEGFRLKLVDAFRVALKKALNLLGIETIEEM